MNYADLYSLGGVEGACSGGGGGLDDKAWTVAINVSESGKISHERLDEKSVLFREMMDRLTIKPKSKLDLAREFLREVEARHPERKVNRIADTYGGTD